MNLDIDKTIEKINDIKQYCKGIDECKKCKFYNKGKDGILMKYDCYLQNLAYEFHCIPEWWDIEYIEDILNGKTRIL